VFGLPVKTAAKLVCNQNVEKPRSRDIIVGMVRGVGVGVGVGVSVNTKHQL
jgi:hypothetical protein